MEAYRLERHLKLWEENNKLIKRVVFLSVAIAVALIVKVLTPFVEVSGEEGPARDRVEDLKKSKRRVNTRLETIENTEAALKDVREFIAKQPWQQNKRDLIQRYRQMRTGHGRDDYQREADETVNAISQMLRENIITRLRRGAGNADARDTDGGRLDAQINELDQFREGWKAKFTGRRWYATLNEKELTMTDLSRELDNRLTSFSDFVARELATIRRTRKAVNEELASLNSKISTEQDKLDQIERDLEDILPEWLRGLVRTNQVIQLMPLLLLGIAAYVLGLGVILTRHFRHYVTGKQFEDALVTDPAMSSTWTLVPRGPIGTTQTLLAYTAFFAVSWYMLEESTSLVQAWLKIDPAAAWIQTSSAWEGFVWFSRIVFVSLVLYVWRTITHARSC